MLETLKNPIRDALIAGATLPSDWYTNPEILRREQREIFQKTWQYAGLLKQLRDPGDYFTTRIGNVPVVVLRDEQSELRAYINICTHRLTEVAIGAGNAKSLQCPYHAWTFGLDGCLKSIPNCGDEHGLDKSRLGLKPIRVETWGIFVFVNLDQDAPPLRAELAETTRILERYGIDIDTLEEGKTTHFDVAANWKILAENYLECYHCPIAHKGFSKLIDVSPERYRLEAVGRELISWGPLRPAPQGGYAEPHGYEPRGEVPGSVWILLWPNFTINILPGARNLSLYYFSPRSPGETNAAFQYFYPPGADENFKAGLEGFWDSVGYEDMALVESVQRAVESGAVETGQLVLSRESLIQAFQLLTCDALGTGAEEGFHDAGRRGWRHGGAD